MIQVIRTGYVEQPNGDLTCTITIPAASRVSALSGAPIVLGDTWGVALQREVAAATFKPPIQEHPSSDAGDTFSTPIEAETAATDTTAPAQSIGVGGFDSASVVAAMAQGEYPWEHPAAPHMATIYRHDPFQQFALRELHADAFAAPMESATRLINTQVRDVPMDVAINRLGHLMDKYAEWATANNLPIWPKG